MAGTLTTHVLDTVKGGPAAGLMIELWKMPHGLDGPTTSSPRVSSLTAPLRLKTVVTNADGRTHQPLLSDDALAVGVYELRFAVGAYFASQEHDIPTPPFLDIVPIRFGIADAIAHYHVPLLCSPWSYSTYRGS